MKMFISNNINNRVFLQLDMFCKELLQMLAFAARDAYQTSLQMYHMHAVYRREDLLPMQVTWACYRCSNSRRKQMDAKAPNNTTTHRRVQ